MLYAKHLRLLVVRPALQQINLWSQDAENLVMGTAAQESRLQYLHQLGNGPAKGLFQMEPATHNDIWDNYLKYHDDWADTLRTMTVTGYMGTPDPNEMVWNLMYAAAMCRVFYRRKPGRLPYDVEGMAAYWKKFYNTHLGAGTEAQFIRNYNLTY